MHDELKKISALFLLVMMTAGPCFGWGQKGHDTTCSIAERHLSHKARKRIAHVLDGKSIVYWSNWLDNASNTPEYAYSKTWHYRDVEDGKTYEETPPAPRGDVITALTEQIAKLKSKRLSHSEEQLALKMVIHLVGDLHTPMHLGRTSDLGGNRFKVAFFKAETNLHAVWDSKLIESGHNWTYTEWSQQIDRLDKKQRKAIIQGSLDDWGKETSLVAQEVYNGTEEEENLSYNYVARWTPVVEQQLLKGGLRLARVLEEIY